MPPLPASVPTTLPGLRARRVCGWANPIAQRVSFQDSPTLRGGSFDPIKVHPSVVRFYEETTGDELDAWAEWCGVFRPFGWMLAVLFSRRLQQLNVPLSGSRYQQRPHKRGPSVCRPCNKFAPSHGLVPAPAGHRRRALRGILFGLQPCCSVLPLREGRVSASERQCNCHHADRVSAGWFLCRRVCRRQVRRAGFLLHSPRSFGRCVGTRCSCATREYSRLSRRGWLSPSRPCPDILRCDIPATSLPHETQARFCQTRRCSEREPADSTRDKSDIIGNLGPSLTWPARQK